MSLKHALLGFLNYTPMTGYELKATFNKSIKHFWNASLSQIYPALSSMEKEGLLTVEVQYQEDRPNRKIYSITEDGKAELTRWLNEPIGLPQVNIAFLVKIFFGAKVDKEKILVQLRHFLKLHEDRLQAYRGEVREELETRVSDTGRNDDGAFWKLTLDAGIAIEEAWTKWCQYSIGKIDEIDE